MFCSNISINSRVLHLENVARIILTVIARKLYNEMIQGTIAFVTLLTCCVRVYGFKYGVVDDGPPIQQRS